MRPMNRETSFSSSDTLVVVDRSRRRRNIIIAAVVGDRDPGRRLLHVRGGGEEQPQARTPARTAAAGRCRPSRSSSPAAARSRASSPPPARSAARRDSRSASPAKAAWLRAVLVDAGAWVRAGPGAGRLDRSVQSQNAAQLAAQVQVARADAALAQNEYERSQSLVGRGFVSKADLDRKKAARDAANRPHPGRPGQLGAKPRPDRPARHSRAARRPDPVAQRRGRPGRQPGLPAPCSAWPRAARWRCARSCRSRTWPSSASRHAGVGHADRYRPQLCRPVWQVSPMIDPTRPPGRGADRHSL